MRKVGIELAVAVGFLAIPIRVTAFECANAEIVQDVGLDRVQAKVLNRRTEGSRSIVVIFAEFGGEKGETDRAPEWAAGFFDVDSPGSFSHFYDTMSFGKLTTRGEVVPRKYASEHMASAYVAHDAGTIGRFGAFNLEILLAADRDIDFARFDDDGPDGLPNSGDDDGVVDAVIINIDSAPANFILGNATGVAQLGLERSFVTNDLGHGGEAIEIGRFKGVLQQGRSFEEAVGVACHEFGHLLGLPDLFNVGFLQGGDLGPEEDSAGIGNWGLMGWGATGWNGNDGPSSFGAWSRKRLGWSSVIQLGDQEQTVSFESIGGADILYEIPLTDREFFLLESRIRSKSYYDRNVPAEGLLIWRARRFSQGPVSLESADGNWTEAGFPTGATPDPIAGGDNLDFWAHEENYSERHGGNLGDATDVFDGVVFTTFARNTNPSSTSSDGRLAPQVSGIRREGDVFTATVSLDPAQPVATLLEVIDVNDDGIIVPGEETKLSLRIVNCGGVDAREVSAEISTADTSLDITNGRVAIGQIPVDATSTLSLSRTELPNVEIRDVNGTRSAIIDVSVYEGEKVSSMSQFAVTMAGVSQEVQMIAVVDTAGNRDGLLQKSEIFGVSISVRTHELEGLQAVRFTLAPLDERVERIGSGQLQFESIDDSTATSFGGPEFILSDGVAPGTDIDFELKVENDFGAVWTDTLLVSVAGGADGTRPRITMLRTRVQDEGLSVFVADRWVVEGSDLSHAEAFFFSAADSSETASVQLVQVPGAFEGVWVDPIPGQYLVRVEMVDSAGNLGVSKFFRASAFAPGGPGVPQFDASSRWQKQDLPAPSREAAPVNVAISPSDPSIWYASTRKALWRSIDGGNTWTRTGLMFGGRYNAATILVDARDSQTVYTADQGELLVSRDGGSTWTPIPLPIQDAPLRTRELSFGPFVIRLPQRLVLGTLSVDPVLPGRIIGGAAEILLLSEDEGATWREISLDGDIEGTWSHSADAASIYAITHRASSAELSEKTLWRSIDSGRTWQRQALEADIVNVSPDPVDPDALFAIRQGALVHSTNGGASWREVESGPASELTDVLALNKPPGTVYVWGRSHTLWRSTDFGGTWESWTVPDVTQGVVPNPGRPGLPVVVAGQDEQARIYEITSLNYS